MKTLLTILFFTLCLNASAWTSKRSWDPINKRFFTTYTYSVTDGSSQNGHTGGYFVINGDVAHHSVGGSTHNLNLAPGDIIQFHGGQYWAMELDWISGFFGNQIIIQNVPGETVWMGDPNWGNSYFSWSFGMKFLNCHHVLLQATTFGQFHFTGSTAGGFGSSGADQSYSNLVVGQFSDHFEIKNLWIREGGHGIWCKTEVDPSNAFTWGSSGTKPTGFYFHDNRIDSSADEGMYLGHTATFWNKTSNAPYYPSDTNDATATSDTSTYKRPITYDSVHVTNNKVFHGRIDGIQCAALDHLEVDHNEVYDWAIGRITNAFSVDIAGILVGGRCKNTNTHDNVIHNGWGDCMEVFCEGPGHLITNNLIYRTWFGEGISIRSTAGTVPMSGLVLTGNTVSEVGSHCTRINMAFGRRDYVYMNANLFIQPYGQYEYTENGGLVQEGTSANLNNKYVDLAASNVNVNCYYKPYNASIVSGYRNPAGCPLPPYTAKRNTGRQFRLKQG